MFGFLRILNNNNRVKEEERKVKRNTVERKEGKERKTRGKENERGCHT